MILGESGEQHALTLEFNTAGEASPLTPCFPFPLLPQTGQLHAGTIKYNQWLHRSEMGKPNCQEGVREQHKWGWFNTLIPIFQWHKTVCSWQSLGYLHIERAMSLPPSYSQYYLILERSIGWVFCGFNGPHPGRCWGFPKRRLQWELRAIDAS